MKIAFPSLGPFRRIDKINPIYSIDGTVKSAYVSNYYSPKLGFYTGYYISFIVYFNNPVDVASFNIGKILSEKKFIYTEMQGPVFFDYREIILPMDELEAEISFTGIAITHGCEIPNHTLDVAEKYASDVVNKTITFKQR